MSEAFVKISYDHFVDILEVNEDEEMIGLYEDPIEDNDEIFKIVTISLNTKRIKTKIYYKEQLGHEIGLVDCKIKKIWNAVADAAIGLLISGSSLPYSINGKPTKCYLVGHCNKTKREVSVFKR
jgi:hypothetical protein